MSHSRWYLVAFVTLLMVGPSLLFSVRPVRADPFVLGDVFAGIYMGFIYHYDASGNNLETINTIGLVSASEMAFDSAGNLYATFAIAGAGGGGYVCIVAGPGDPHTVLENIYTWDPASPDPDYSPIGIVFDTVGNLYVGHAAGGADIHKYDPAGNLLTEYDVATELGGSNHIDLASDQTTMFYTSAGTSVKRFDLNTNTQLADFATGLPGSHARALRIMQDGGVLVADTEVIVRLDSAGNVIQTYDAPGEDTWLSLSLDPDCTSFWSGSGGGTGKFYKFDIATGNQLMSVDTGTVDFGGLVVYGEIRAALPPLGVIPEVPFGTAMIFLCMLIALAGFLGFKRLRLKSPTQ